MQITLVQIAGRTRKQDVYDPLVRDYLKHCVEVARCATESFPNEAAFFEWIGRQKGRTVPAVLLLDGRGRQMSSEAFADWLGRHRNEGTQHVVFAIGPADGWSDEARARARLRGGLLSLGTMTLAHQMARLVVAEQIYRACTILTGHPYHKGH